MTAPIVTGATNLAVGVTTRLTPPNPAAVIGSVVIQNLSGFLLVVQIGAAAYSLPAYGQDLFVTDNTGVQVQLTPSNPDGSPAGLPAYALATWYAPGATPDGAAYPSPLTGPVAALALAIAEELAAGGIPSVLVETVVITPTVILHGAHLGPFDVSGYASLVITSTGAGLTYYEIYAPDGTLLDRDYAPPLSATTIRTNGTAMSLFYVNPAGQTTVEVIGSNRAPVVRYDTRQTTALGDTQSVSQAPFVAATTYNLIPSTPFAAGLQGLCYLDCGASGTVVTGNVTLINFNGTTLALCDTTEMHTMAAGTQRRVSKLVAVPSGPYQLTFTCGTGGNGTIAINLVPAEL